ncbi:MAG: hypothetical protein ACPGWM_02660, partial [Flavobacteriales bacterium]
RESKEKCNRFHPLFLNLPPIFIFCHFRDVNQLQICYFVVAATLYFGSKFDDCEKLFISHLN